MPVIHSPWGANGDNKLPLTHQWESQRQMGRFRGADAPPRSRNVDCGMRPGFLVQVALRILNATGRCLHDNTLPPKHMQRYDIPRTHSTPTRPSCITYHIKAPVHIILFVPSGGHVFRPNILPCLPSQCVRAIECQLVVPSSFVTSVSSSRLHSLFPSISVHI